MVVHAKVVNDPDQRVVCVSVYTYGKFVERRIGGSESYAGSQTAIVVEVRRCAIPGYCKMDPTRGDGAE